VRLAARRRRPSAIDPVAADARRFRTTHLDERLGADEHAVAAAAGLQDSAPRSALLSLHARMRGVEPDSWEHPSLVQTWFRWADFVVPRADFGLFTRGAMPRDPEAARELEAFAESVVRVLDGSARRTREVADELGGADARAAGHSLRVAAVTGRYRIRWDAVSIFVVPEARPEVDDEEARLALARRFVQVHGPATVHDLARWAGLTRDDAATTWAAIDPSPTEADAELQADEGELVHGVRLLPMGDPWLQLHTDAPRATRPPDVPSKVRNSLTGRIVLDGEPVGAWARAKGDVTLDAWEPLGDDDRQRVEDEAATFTGPLALPVRTRWIS
jgi:hypothetical protein